MVIDRIEGKENKMPDEKIITEGCTDIKPLPGYDYNKFPYCITRSQFSINLLDTKNTQVHCLLLDKKPDFDNEFMSIVHDENGEVGIVYAISTKDENCDVIK